METKSDGQLAYEAYFDHCGWKSLMSGAALPLWGDQADEIKAAWEAAGTAVRAFDRPPHH